MFRRCCVAALQAGRRCRGPVLQVSQESGQGPGTNQWAQVRSKHWGSTGYQSFQGQPRQLVTFRDPQAQRIIIFIAGSTVFIWWASREEVPYTHRKHSILVPRWMEQQMGQQTFQQITTMAAAEGKLLPAAHPATLLVEKIGRKVARVAAEPPEDGRGYIEHMKGLKWEFAVIDEVDPNAFVVPGGKVVVYTGLLKLLDDETQLANVLSHEAAHVVARHAAERMTQGATFEVLRMIAYWTIGIAPPSGLAVAVFFLPNSRRAETEADTIGLRLAAKCCYDPAGAAIVFRKLCQMEKEAGLDRMPGFLRTHPQTDARIKNVQAQLPAARQIFETRCFPGGGEAVPGWEALQELMHPDTVTHDDDDGEFA